MGYYTRQREYPTFSTGGIRTHGIPGIDILFLNQLSYEGWNVKGISYLMMMCCVAR